MDTREEIGKRIYELRRYFKITQKELCEGICTQAYISKIENGSLAIAADILFEISERLGVDINYFYDSTYNPRVDYSLEVELEARDLVKKDDYVKLNDLIKREEKTPLMNNRKFKQLILWHKSLCKRFLENDFDSALKLLNEALALSNTSNKSYSEREIQILINKGNLYLDIENIEHAIEIYKEAKTALEKLPYIHDNNLLTMIFYNLARTYTLSKEYFDAINYAEEGINHCIRHHSLYGLVQFYFLLGINHKKLKNYTFSLENFKRAKSVFELTKHEVSIQKADWNIEEINQELKSTNTIN